MNASWRLAGAVLAAALAVPATLAAHSQPYSWVELRVERGSARGSVTAHVVDLAHAIGEPAPESLGTATGLAVRRARLEAALDRLLDVSADGRRLRPRWTSAALVSEKQAVRFEFALPEVRGAELALAGPLFTWEAQHETYFNGWVDGALRHQDLLDHRHRRSAFATGRPPSPLAVGLRFVREGLRHIFVGPDHVLFIVGLLLLGGGVRRLAKIVTAFTVAHSVTLVLATLRLVDPPARIVEPLIALSIVAIGVENLRSAGRGDDRRAWLAFGFGFVHGFGFAGVLRELDLPSGALGTALFSFNLGVEIAQLSIVLALSPWLAALARRSPVAGARVLAWGSAAVIAAGGFWLVQRVFFGA